MFVMKLPGTISDATAPLLPGVVDPLIVGANGGILSLFDLSTVVSWPKQAAPVNNDTVKTLMPGGGDLSVVVTTGGPTFAGGGFDYTGVTGEPNVVQGAAGSLSTIAAAATDYFLVAGYFKFPARADWNVTTSAAPFFSAGDVGGGYSVEAELAYMGAGAGSGGVPTGVEAGRQTALGSVVRLNLTDPIMANHYGKIGQLAFWRNAAGHGFRVKTSFGSDKVTAVVGAETNVDFSAKRPKWGIPVPFSNSGRTGYRVYRGFIENLLTSGRDPETVLDADYARVISRFS